MSVTWYKDDKEISSDEFDRREEDSGVYSLTLRNIKKKDAGKYTVKIVTPYVTRETSASLVVKGLPVAIKQLPKGEREEFIKAAKEGTTQRRFVRIMIVGESSAGKTSLLCRLLNQSNENVTSTNGINFEIRRCWIDLRTGEWIIRKENDSEMPSSENLVQIGFWDFAGQKDFYATHQTFLSDNAIYLIVANITKDYKSTRNHDKMEVDFDDIGGYLDFWLDNIHCYALKTDCTKRQLDPPVFIVATHIDQVEKCKRAEAKRNFIKHIEQVLRKEEKGRHIREHLFCVSNKQPDTEGSNFDRLKQEVFKLVKETVNKNEQLPKRWNLLEKDLEDMFVIKNKTITTYNEVVEMGKTKNITTDIDAFLLYETEIGKIVYFQTIQNFIVLDPQILANAFRCLITSSEFQIRHSDMILLHETGKLSYTLVEELLQKLPELSLYKKEFLQVMEQFDIIVKKPDVYYMPCMITSGDVENILVQFRNKDEICSPWLCMEFGFLPMALFYHVLVYFIKIKTILLKHFPVDGSHGDDKIGLCRGAGIFELDPKGNLKLVLCSSTNSIELQVWYSNRFKHVSFGDIQSLLVKKVNNLLERFRMNITYQFKIMSHEQKHFSRSGRKHPLAYLDFLNNTEPLNRQQFIQQETFDEDMYTLWFGKNLKEVHMGQLEDQIDIEIAVDTSKLPNLQASKQDSIIKCTFCNRSAPFHCKECQTDICGACDQVHSLNNHCIRNTDDQYIREEFDYFPNNMAKTDWKMFPDGRFIAKLDYSFFIYDNHGKYLNEIPYETLQNINKPTVFRGFTVVDNTTIAVCGRPYFDLVICTVYNVKKKLVLDQFIIDDQGNKLTVSEINTRRHVRIEQAYKEWFRIVDIVSIDRMLIIGLINTITICEINGKMLHKVSLPFRPSFLCSDNSLGLEQIYSFNEDACEFYCLKKEDNTFKPLKLNMPKVENVYGITMDDEGFLVFCRRNPEVIYRFNLSTEKCEIVIHRLPKLPLESHISMYYHNQSKQLIIRSTDEVWIYKRV